MRRIPARAALAVSLEEARRAIRLHLRRLPPAGSPGEPPVHGGGATAGR